MADCRQIATHCTPLVAKKQSLPIAPGIQLWQEAMVRVGELGTQKTATVGDTLLL